MEISRKIIRSAFRTLTNEGCKDLQAMLEAQYMLSENELLFSGSEASRNISIKMHAFFAGILSGSLSEEAMIVRVSRVIRTSATCLKRALEDKDPKAMLLFCKLNTFLHLSLKEMSEVVDITAEHSTSWSNYFSKLFPTFSFELSIPEDTPYSERETLAKSEEGLRTGNFENAFALVSAMENGIGIGENLVLHELLAVFAEMDFDKYSEYMDSLVHPLNICRYLNTFTLEQLMKLASSNKLASKWLLIALIRAVDKKMQAVNGDSSSLPDLQNVLALLFRSDVSFYRKAIQFFNRSDAYHQSLGFHMSGLQQELIADIVDKDFKIDIYNFSNRSKDIFLRAFERLAPLESYEFLLRQFYDKWDGFLQSYLSEHPDKIGAPILTDYSNIIAEYVHRLSEAELMEGILQLTKQLREIPYTWFKSSSIQGAHFNVILGRLYVFSCVYKYKKLCNPDITEVAKGAKRNLQGIISNIRDDSAIFEYAIENLTT